MVEALVGHAEADQLAPGVAGWVGLGAANQAAVAWCRGQRAVRTETCAAPAERLAAEREVLRPLPGLRPPLRRGETRKVDRLATVRFGSARYFILVNYSIHLVARVETFVDRRGTEAMTDQAGK